MNILLLQQDWFESDGAVHESFQNKFLTITSISQEDCM